MWDIIKSTILVRGACAIPGKLAIADCEVVQMSFLPSIVPRLQARVLSHPVVAENATLKAFCEHPAGPFTIHFWAPSFKWAITIANLADINRPTNLLSTPQQTAVAATGIIWSRYSTVITPVNWNLFSVNILMAATGCYQLFRIATSTSAETPESENKPAS